MKETVAKFLYQKVSITVLGKAILGEHLSHG